MPADEIDTCNDDLVVAITEIIVGKPDPYRKSSNFTEKFIELNPKQLGRKTTEKRISHLLFLSPEDALERKKKRALGTAAVVRVAVAAASIRLRVRRQRAYWYIHHEQNIF